MEKLKVNLYGESWHLLRLNNHSNELTYTSIVGGLLNTYKSQIEFWLSGKKISRIKMSTITNEYLLFPVYNMHISDFEISNLGFGPFIEREEIGLFRTYEIFDEHILMDHLVFHYCRMRLVNRTFSVLHSISYKNQKLPTKNSDSLITKEILFNKSALII